MLTRVLPLCDRATIYDNSTKLDKIARYKDGKWELLNKKCQWFNEVMSEMQKVTNRVGEEIQEKPMQSMESYKTEIERLKKGIGKTGQNNSIGKQYSRMDWNKDKKDRWIIYNVRGKVTSLSPFIFMYIILKEFKNC